MFVLLRAGKDSVFKFLDIATGMETGSLSRGSGRVGRKTVHPGYPSSWNSGYRSRRLIMGRITSHGRPKFGSQIGQLSRIDRIFGLGAHGVCAPGGGPVAR